ncbi:MAG: GntR family transcriptional regulator [Anaerolineaceae bacterium]|nr:GntR family transcriptional regulator [Anaerolineaceae bacterium]
MNIKYMHTSVQTPLITRLESASLTRVCIDAIREAILTGKYAEGDQLPSEAELGKMLGVSRTTLREALRTIEEQGLIVRRRGLGTFVAGLPIAKDLSLNFGITKMIKEAGHIPGTKGVKIYKEAVSPSMAVDLKIKEDSTIIVVERVRTQDGQPIAWSVNTIPLERVGENALGEFKPETESLYEYYASTLKINIVYGNAELLPIAATTQLATILEVRKGCPLMRITQIDYDTGSYPILHSVDYHIPGSSKFIIKRKGPNW